MAQESSVFQEISKELDKVLPADEKPVGVALTLAGPRLLTFFMHGGPSGRWLFASLPIAQVIALFTGLVGHWLLVATSRHIVAVKVRGLRMFWSASLRPLGEVRVSQFADSTVRVTNNLWSGWLIEVEDEAAGFRKYSAYAPNGAEKKKLNFPPDWTFDEFADSLEYNRDNVA